MSPQAMAETQQDMDAALRAIERALASKMGDDVRCDAPMQQAYSSSNINGNVSKQIQLVTRASGSKGHGTVRCLAIIDGNGNVDLRQLDVDGDSVSTSGSRLRDTKGGGVIIDV